MLMCRPHVYTYCLAQLTHRHDDGCIHAGIQPARQPGRQVKQSTQSTGAAHLNQVFVNEWRNKIMYGYTAATVIQVLSCSQVNLDHIIAALYWTLFIIIIFFLPNGSHKNIKKHKCAYPNPIRCDQRMYILY